MKDFPLKIGIADLKNKIWLIQLTKICNPSFKMRIAHALIVGALQGLPTGFDIMYLALRDRNIQVRFGLKVVWES